MAAGFVVRLEVPLASAGAWARVWDLRRHTETIPLTTVAPTPPATVLAEGVGFCGRTVVGPVGFDDPMRVVSWEPPGDDGRGRAVIEKTGHVIGGRIEVTLVPFAGGVMDPAPAGGGGTGITWCQTVVLPWLPAWLRGLEHLVAPVVAPGYRLILRRLLRP